MGVLSKPNKIAFELIGSYFNQLYMKPYRTKSITSCILAALANYIYQKCKSNKRVNYKAVAAFAVFGLLFGGTLPHYFYKIVMDLVSNNSAQAFFVETMIFRPVYIFFSLYALARLEGYQSVENNAMPIFENTLKLHFKYIFILNILNLYYVAPVLRPLSSNVIDLIWYILLSYVRDQAKKIKKN